MLLCEECAETCGECGKALCPEHINRSRSGKVFCEGCFDVRYGMGEDTTFAGLGGAELAGVGAHEGEGEEEEDEERPVLGGWQPPPAWKLSLQVASFGAAAVLLLLVFPSLRRLILPGDMVLYTPMVLLAVPGMAILWAVIGLRSEEEPPEQRPRCIGGIVLAGATILLSFYAVFSDPIRQTEQDLREMRLERDGMTSEELGEWRQRVLSQ